MTVRVRMAPGPSGKLHVGTARAALFNWLFARHHGGVFIVRVDDTDKERSSREFENEILDSLRWLGLDWDEGVGVGGPAENYRQSERFERYQQVAQDLVSSGAAYYDDRPADVLDELRKKAQSENKHPGHYIRRPDAEATAGVIRLAIPTGDSVVFDDVVRGTVTFESRDIDDFVILRSDGSPTYHLASTVDDVDYEITHVARGEDLLPSTPKHIVLTKAMGYEPPTYAHLPLLFGTDGRKLSKRHGATALRDFREQGFLADAVFNYLATLGWSPDSETTIFSREEAIASFDLADVNKAPAAFDPDKMAWMNGEYIRAMPRDDFNSAVRPHVEEAVGRALAEDEWTRFESISELVQERTKLLPEAGSQVVFLFNEVESYDETSWNKVMTNEGVGDILDSTRLTLSELDDWSSESIESGLRSMIEGMAIGVGKALQPIRVAVTGSSISPPLFESLAALGRGKSLERIGQARDLLD